MHELETKDNIKLQHLRYINALVMQQYTGAEVYECIARTDEFELI